MAIIFLVCVVVQLIVTGVLVGILPRRLAPVSRRLRLAAPAPVPIVGAGLMLAGFLAWARHEPAVRLSGEIGVFVLAILYFAAIWLVGVLWAGMIIRRRR